MELEAIYTNTNGAQASGPASTNNIDKLYIILDFNKQGSSIRDASGTVIDYDDAKRDKIKFVTPKIDYTIDISDIKLKVPKELLVEVEKEAKAAFLRTFPNPEGGVDTLSPIGWRGIWALNIEDALIKAKAFLGKRKVKTIVIRSHGSVNNPSRIVHMCIDNNWSHLTPEEQQHSGKKTDSISTTLLDCYLEDKNHDAFNSSNYPEVKLYIEALKELIDCVRDDGDFVVGSCHSAYNNHFLSALQLISGSRVNMYGIYFLSSFKMEHGASVKTKVTLRKAKSTGQTDKIDIQSTTTDLGGDTAYITSDKVFSDSSLLNPLDMKKQPVENYAMRFPVGWVKGNTPTKLNKLNLNKDGVSY